MSITLLIQSETELNLKCTLICNKIQITFICSLKSGEFSFLQALT